MARPKTDHAERLRVKSMMHFIAEEESLPLKPHVLEKYFEPENIKVNELTGQISDSGKWRRFLKAGVFPGEKSFKRISDICPNAIRHLKSPFWDAIRFKDRSYQEWSAFYRSLEADVEAAVLHYIVAPSQISSNGIQKDNNAIEQLVRIGDDHAVAALIGLLRQYNRSIFLHEPVQTGLHKILFSFLSRFCPSTFWGEIYQYLYTTIFYQIRAKRKKALTWPTAISDVEAKIREAQSVFRLAEKLAFVDSFTTHAEFCYWRLRGKTNLITKEMQKLVKNSDFSHTSPKTKKGLRWLIKKLNRERPASHQLPKHLYK